MSVDNTHKNAFSVLDAPPRLLCGPGPSNASPRVLKALSTPQVGHLDPFFINTMNEIQQMLRYTMQTSNAFTVPISGTGSAAMEACFANLIEQGDVVLVAANGYFGLRMVDMSQRYGADVRKVEKPWGEVFTLEEIKRAIVEHSPAIFAIVHAETSTGACQPLEGIADFCREHNCLLLVDCVTSLGGVPLFLDQWGVDASYSGSQKCLSCPPGIAPLSFGPRAMQKLKDRKTKVPNWYLDLSMLAAYWGTGERTYHHTAPISMNYALREALQLVVEEGLEASWKRHRDNAERMWAGLEAMGLSCHVEAAYRLPSLTTVRIPEGIDGKAVTRYVLQHFSMEIGNGLGQLAGKVWRVGLMGYNSREDTVLMILGALREALKDQNYAFPSSA